MAEHTWPLKNRIPAEFVFFTKGELIEILDGIDDETPIWINNYWQPVRQITQRPMEVYANRPDGIHLG